jgi:hypothetical protein
LPVGHGKVASMKPRDILGLIIRIVGVYMVVKGIALLGKMVVLLLDERGGWELSLLAGVGYTVLGIYFLRGAPYLLKSAYPEKSDHPTPDPAKQPGIQ